ncbi:MAG: hypothetical protein HPY66_2341 [Firmicutes bacterium]|nr:hypothetical protein [Bacillota bacterium]
MEYVATFFTHSGAMKYKRYMEKNGITIELLPVPRKLSSDCGIGVRVVLDGDIRRYISEDIHKLFAVEGGRERLIYSA